MNFTIGQRVLYRPAGRFGHIVANFGDRHRVRLRLEPTSDLPVSEVDEVAYHDLESVEATPPAPAPAPVPAPPDPAPQVLDETREDAADDRPRRGRRLWPEPPERTDG